MNANVWFWLFWVAIAFPAAVLILGEIAAKLRQQGIKLAGLVESLRNLVLPTAVVFVVFWKILGWERGAIPVRLSETLMWIAIIYTVLTFLNLILFEEAREGTWRANAPKIFVDTSRFLLVLVGTAIVLSTVWEADVGGLLAALGLGSLVIGLALQDSLGNVFSGVALLFERPFKLGEWIKVGDTMGKVDQITWRSVHLITKAGFMVIVPNSELARGRIQNFNRPKCTYEIALELGFSFDDPPNKVKSVILQTASSIPGILSEPKPQVLTSDYGDFRITYQILLFVESYSQERDVRECFLTRLWYAIKRAGLTVPYPIAWEIAWETEYRPKTLTREQRGEQVEIARRTLMSVQSFALYPDEIIDRLSRQGIWLEYAGEEVVIAEGEPLAGMYLVLSGRAKILAADKKGCQQKLCEVSRGEFFGEKASLLSEQNSDVTVVADEDLTVLLLDKAMIQEMLAYSSRLANDLGESMELRRRAIAAL